jgi:hypothetical protein
MLVLYGIVNLTHAADSMGAGRLTRPKKAIREDMMFYRMFVAFVACSMLASGCKDLAESVENSAKRELEKAGDNLKVAAEEATQVAGEKVKKGAKVVGEKVGRGAKKAEKALAVLMEEDQVADNSDENSVVRRCLVKRQNLVGGRGAEFWAARAGYVVGASRCLGTTVPAEDIRAFLGDTADFVTIAIAPAFATAGPLKPLLTENPADALPPGFTIEFDPSVSTMELRKNGRKLNLLGDQNYYGGSY